LARSGKPACTVLKSAHWVSSLNTADGAGEANLLKPDGAVAAHFSTDEYACGAAALTRIRHPRSIRTAPVSLQESCKNNEFGTICKAWGRLTNADMSLSAREIADTP
jgi:hypothetical protein